MEMLYIALVIGAVIVAGKYLEHRYDVKRINSFVETSKQETERLRLLLEAAKGNKEQCQRIISCMLDSE